MANTYNDTTTEELRDQIATLRADFAKLSDTATDGIKESVGAARREVVKSTREARDGLAESIMANPLTAVGVAAGVGYLLGVLTRR